jgi:hypothetical protein
MKTLISFFTVAVLVLAMPAISQAAKNKSDGTKGKITAVDDKSITVENKKSSETKTFKIDDKTTISVDGADNKKASDLKAGMRADVTAGDQPDVAKSITATSKKKKAA